MSPIPIVTPTAAGVLPYGGMATPEAAPLPTTRIQMPEELAEPTGTGSVQAPNQSFSSMLGQFVSDVNAQQNISAQAVSAVQSGQNVPLHQAVIAMEEANVSFQLMVEVRNRLLDAYQEIMRMQI
jgi:flagellar hook-basal body complex protein FliE